MFETGHVVLARRFIEDGYVKPPGMFQICLGISWGQPATPEAMSYMRSLLPPDSPWFAFGVSRHQFPMVAQAVLLGGHPRVGLEDNIYLEKGKLAPSNAALVEKAGRIIELLGDQVATPAEARQMLGSQAAKAAASTGPGVARSGAAGGSRPPSRPRSLLACTYRRILYRGVVIQNYEMTPGSDARSGFFGVIVDVLPGRFGALRRRVGAAYSARSRLAAVRLRSTGHWTVGRGA